MPSTKIHAAINAASHGQSSKPRKIQTDDSTEIHAAINGRASRPRKLTTDKFINSLMSERNRFLKDARYYHKYSDALNLTVNEMTEELNKYQEAQWDPLPPVPELDILHDDKDRLLKNVTHPIALRHLRDAGLIK